MKEQYGTYTLDWLPKKRKKDYQETTVPDNAPEPFFSKENGNDVILFWLLIPFCIVVAIFCYTISGTSSPKNLHLLGTRFVSQGEYDKAIDCFTKGLTLEPYNVALYLERGKVHEIKGHFSAALADYDQACRYVVANVEALDRRTSLCLQLAEAEIHADDLPKALDYCTRSLAVDDGYVILEWREKFYCPHRLHTYVTRKRCLDNSDDPIHRLLANADSYWIEINKAYLGGSDEKVWHSLDQNCAYSLNFAEWHYGQENYALAIECLRQSVAQAEFAQLPIELQETFHNLKKNLEEMLKEGVPPGVFSHASRLGITMSTPPLPVVVPVPENESTELENRHE